MWHIERDGIAHKSPTVQLKDGQRVRGQNQREVQKLASTEEELQLLRRNHRFKSLCHTLRSEHSSNGGTGRVLLPIGAMVIGWNRLKLGACQFEKRRTTMSPELTRS